MKAFIALSLLTLSVSSFASTASLIESCRAVGTQKVIAQAEAFGVRVNAEDVKECGVDNRPLNISKYVWFCAKVEGHETVKVLTQKPMLGKCF